MTGDNFEADSSTGTYWYYKWSFIPVGDGIEDEYFICTCQAGYPGPNFDVGSWDQFCPEEGNTYNKVCLQWVLNSRATEDNGFDPDVNVPEPILKATYPGSGIYNNNNYRWTIQGKPLDQYS